MDHAGMEIDRHDKTESPLFAKNGIWHTGEYDIKTDQFKGGELACYVPDGESQKIITAKTMQELEAKFYAALT